MLLGLDYRPDLVTFGRCWCFLWKIYSLDGSIGLSFSDMFLQVLISLTGHEISSTNDAKYLIFHYFRIAEEICLLIVEIQVVVVGRVRRTAEGLLGRKSISRVAGHHWRAVHRIVPVRWRRRTGSVGWVLWRRWWWSSDVVGVGDGDATTYWGLVVGWRWRSEEGLGLVVGLGREGVDYLLGEGRRRSVIGSRIRGHHDE